MINNRVLMKLLLFYTLYSGFFIGNVNAGSRPIVTVRGEEIFPVQIQDRMVRLLGELREPAWTKKEIKRMMIPVIAYLRAFTGRQYERTLAALKRADKYRPMIRKELKNLNLPRALEALPMAESAFRYGARSKQGAYGLWQFMPVTARHYNLKINATLDQRADPVLSTRSALRYLKNINKKFSRISILLSIAAYNAGEGRIQKIVTKSGMNRKTRGYSRIIRFLPKETRGYVPEFLAAALILKNPAFFGFPVSNTLDHQYLLIAKQQALETLVKQFDISLDLLYQLNPELGKRIKTPVNNFILRLPNKYASQFKKSFPDSVYWKPISNPIDLNYKVDAEKELVYTVRMGNYLGGIADLFNVSIKNLRKWNKIKGNKITAGQRLIIHTKKPLKRKIYRIQPGDILGLIAQTLGVSIDHLMFINGVSNPRKLRVGNRLFYYEQQA